MRVHIEPKLRDLNMHEKSVKTAYPCSDVA